MFVVDSTKRVKILFINWFKILTKPFSTISQMKYTSADGISTFYSVIVALVLVGVIDCVSNLACGLMPILIVIGSISLVFDATVLWLLGKLFRSGIAYNEWITKYLYVGSLFYLLLRIPYPLPNIDALPFVYMFFIVGLLIKEIMELSKRKTLYLMAIYIVYYFAAAILLDGIFIAISK